MLVCLFVFVCFFVIRFYVCLLMCVYAYVCVCECQGCGVCVCVCVCAKRVKVSIDLQCLIEIHPHESLSECLITTNRAGKLLAVLAGP